MGYDFDYEGDMDFFQNQLTKVGITKDELDMDNFAGCTRNELQSVVNSAIAGRKEKDRKAVEAKIVKVARELLEILEEYNENTDYFSMVIYAKDDYLSFNNDPDKDYKEKKISYLGGF